MRLGSFGHLPFLLGLGVFVSSAFSQTCGPPKNCSLSQTSNHRSFALSYSAGSGIGGPGSCRISYSVNGSSTWKYLNGLAFGSTGGDIDCDTTGVNIPLQLPATFEPWDTVDIRLIRDEDDMMMCYVGQLRCASTGPDLGASPAGVDENCNGIWDDKLPGSCTITHTPNRRNMTVSWTGGNLNGGVNGCRIEYSRSGGETVTLLDNVNCDADSSHGVNFTGLGGNWGNGPNPVSVNLVRKSDSSAVCSFGVATCNPAPPDVAGTPDIDEDCNGAFSPNFTLTLTMDPACGTLSAVPAGPTYVAGTNVTVNATLNAGYTITDWAGDDGSTPTSATVTMNWDRTVLAQCSNAAPPADTCTAGGGTWGPLQSWRDSCCDNLGPYATMGTACSGFGGEIVQGCRRCSNNPNLWLLRYQLVCIPPLTPSPRNQEVTCP